MKAIGLSKLQDCILYKEVLTSISCSQVKFQFMTIQTAKANCAVGSCGAAFMLSSPR